VSKNFTVPIGIIASSKKQKFRAKSGTENE
jgi:hypothetical protein